MLRLLTNFKLGYKKQAVEQSAYPPFCKNKREAIVFNFYIKDASLLFLPSAQKNTLHCNFDSKAHYIYALQSVLMKINQ